MKKATFILGIVLVGSSALVLQSCSGENENKVETAGGHDFDDGHHDNETQEGSSDHHSSSSNAENTDRKELIQDYLALKEALTKDDEKKASKIAGKLTETIKGFNSASFSENEQAEIKDILETSLEHAEHIAKSPISHQREHFKDLSGDMIDLIAITGTSTKLYEQYCPMFDNNKGASWISAASTVENPYYGSSMLSCGEVKKEYQATK